MICQQCHHRPSVRFVPYGAECTCRCHDIADAAPELLAACELMAGWLKQSGGWDEAMEDNGIYAVVAKAKGDAS